MRGLTQMSASAERLDQLRALTEKWRERARKAENEYEAQKLTDRGTYCLGKSESITRCADELDALLTRERS